MALLHCRVAHLLRHRTWIGLSGDLTVLHADDLAEELEELAVPPPPKTIYLDLSLVTRMDTAGLEAVGHALPTGVGLHVIEPASLGWAEPMIRRTFPAAALHASLSALCAAERLATVPGNWREFQRHPLHVPVRVELAGERSSSTRQFFEASTADFSRGGACLVDLRREGRPFPAEELAGAEMVLYLRERPEGLPAAAVRVASEREPHGLGIRFAPSHRRSGRRATTH